MFTVPLREASHAFWQEAQAIELLAVRDWSALIQIPTPPDESRYFATKDTIALLRRWAYPEVLLVRAVDNLMIYLTEVLECLFVHQPVTLKAEVSKMSIPAVELLDVAMSGEEVQALVMRRKIAEVDGKGVRGFRELMNRLKVDLEFSEDEARQLDAVIARRNLIRHRRGRIDSAYLKAVQSDDRALLGQRVEVSKADLLADLGTIRVCAEKISKAIGRKFKLDQRDWHLHVAEAKSKKADLSKRVKP